jgi:hypothetical protein
LLFFTYKRTGQFAENPQRVLLKKAPLVLEAEQTALVYVKRKIIKLKSLGVMFYVSFHQHELAQRAEASEQLSVH